MDYIERADIVECERRYLPHELKTSPRFNVRPFSDEETAELEEDRIEALALSLESQGQLENVLVSEDLTIISGHRRRRAALLINERRTAKGGPLFRLRVAKVKSGDLWQKAITANLQREHLSPVDIAILIKQVRKEKGWELPKDTHRVAGFLGIKYASLLQYEKLYSVERDLQRKLHNGVLSMQSVLDLLRLPSPEERAQAVKRASAYQEEDRLDKIVERAITGKISQTTALKQIQDTSRARIEHPAVLKAIRESSTTKTITKPIGRSRSELVRCITELAHEAYPPPVRQVFCHLEDFCLGQTDFSELRSSVLALFPNDGVARKPMRAEPPHTKAVAS